MALSLSTSTVPCFGFRIKHFKGQVSPVHWCSRFSRSFNQRTAVRCSTKVPTIAQFGEPNKQKMQVDDFGEKLLQTLPEPVKEFPWKKAEDIVLKRLLFLGQRALEWSLITLFVLSSLSDVVLSISRSKELLIPLGLFIGCVVADFLKETTKELLPSTKEGGLKRHLVVVGAFFVLVKVISSYFTIGGRLLLSHIGNGGLMQVLWLWKNQHEETSNDKTSVATNMEN